MKIAVVGYGIEGKTLVQYFGKRGDEITVCDIEEARIKKQKPKGRVHFKFGKNYLDDLSGFDLIFRSPGIPYLKKEFDSVRSKLTSATKYFFQNCPCPIIGVTGTKGKGTTASLIYEMLRAQRKVFLGGNIGRVPLEFLDELTPKNIVVLELSSFQLQDLDRSPHIAVVLGITPDHLDHHVDMAEYVEAKKNIVRFQTKKDFAIFDVDNERTAAFARQTKAHAFSVSTEKLVTEGGFVKVGSLTIAGRERGMIIGEIGHTGLIGMHNVKNILAAATVATILGVPVEIISRVAREFHGLPHRLEFVRELDSVKYYNDSASTNPETAIAALASFNNSTILIAGGSDKNIDFTPLGEVIAKRLNVKTVILMGETKLKIERAIENAVEQEGKRTAELQAKTGRPVRKRDIPLELISADNYQEAFMVAKVLAQPGDTVLLSPASASFDMFKNYQERGEVFRNFVMDL